MSSSACCFALRPRLGLHVQHVVDALPRLLHPTHLSAWWMRYPGSSTQCINISWNKTSARQLHDMNLHEIMTSEWNYLAKQPFFEHPRCIPQRGTLPNFSRILNPKQILKVFKSEPLQSGKTANAKVGSTATFQKSWTLNSIWNFLVIKIFESRSPQRAHSAVEKP